MLVQARALFANEKNLLSNPSNASTLLKMTLPNSVFTGSYSFGGQELLLGPLQDGVSYIHIVPGKGVCGEAATNQETIIVTDVTEHVNYISCDPAAMSEITVPMVKNNQLAGVSDLDSRLMNDYNVIDREYLEKFATVLLEKSYWSLGMFGVEK